MRKLIDFFERKKIIVPSAAAFMTALSLLTVVHKLEFATGYFAGVMSAIALVIYMDEEEPT